MINHISIKNFAIIENTEVDFENDGSFESPYTIVME